MAKSKGSPSLLPIFILITVIATIAGAVYYFQKQPAEFEKLVNKTRESVKGVAEDASTKELLSQAQKKLLDSQPIMKDDQSSAGAVLGDQSTISVQAQQLVNQTGEKIKSEIQNLPKKEAAKIIRQTCEQIATELEKEAE